MNGESSLKSLKRRQLHRMDPGFPRILEDFQGPKHRIQRCYAGARNSIGFSSLYTAAPVARRSHRDDGVVDHHRKEKFESLEAKWVWGVADYSMLLLRRLAYRLMAQLTFLGKVQTVNLNVSYEDVSVSTHFTRISDLFLSTSIEFLTLWPKGNCLVFN